ncbi:hypothetical protein RYX36_030965 [Vicia faba]
MVISTFQTPRPPATSHTRRLHCLFSWRLSEIEIFSLNKTLRQFLFPMLMAIMLFNGLLSITSMKLLTISFSNAKDNMQQTALHWATVRGSVAAAGVLLENGARVEAADINGYRAVHVAAQYGQTVFLNHVVVKCHADFDVPDNDGRSPLHWAAYKGYADTIRLLLFRDTSQGRQDKDGCTPLHWAALRGHSEACAVLVHAGIKEELMVKDNAGFTPVQLAYDKGHRHVAPFLSNQQQAHSSHWRGKLYCGMVTDIGYAPILLCIIVSLSILFINYRISLIKPLFTSAFRSQ